MSWQTYSGSQQGPLQVRLSEKKIERTARLLAAISCHLRRITLLMLLFWSLRSKDFSSFSKNPQNKL